MTGYPCSGRDAVLTDRRVVHIRPVTPEDGPAMRALHEGSSGQSSYQRTVMVAQHGPASRMRTRGTMVAGDLFGPIGRGRLPELIADRVRLLIRTGQLQAGDRLPTERHLSERFRVSRTTVRAAIRALESTGLVQVRAGAGGGAFVAAPSPARIGEQVTDLLATSALTPAQLAEAWLVTERGIAVVVCERATRDDIAELRQICRRSGNAAREEIRDAELCAAFHARAAQAVHNHAIELLAACIREPLLLSLGRACEGASAGDGDEGLREHAAFADAVADGDAGKAASVMDRHLRRVLSRVSPAAMSPGRAKAASCRFQWHAP